MDIQFLALLQVLALTVEDLSWHEDIDLNESDALKSISLLLLYIKRTVAARHGIGEHEIDSIANAMQKVVSEQWFGG